MVNENIKRKWSLSQILVIINVIIFGAMWLTDRSLSTQTLVNFGAKLSFRIVDGEWYRLITPMFLHVDLLHLLFNCTALLSFGTETEMIFGKKKFLIIYFVSGLCGSIGSFLYSPGVSAGASGAIFGLIGANLYLLTLNKELYKRVFGNSVLVILVINILYGITNPAIDDSAHIAGLIGGFLTTWSIGYMHQKVFSWRNHVARALLVVLVVGGTGLGYFMEKDSKDYFYYKGAFLINEGKIDEAKRVFTNGLSLYPDQEEFSEILDQIDTYENTVENQQ